MPIRDGARALFLLAALAFLPGAGFAEDRATIPDSPAVPAAEGVRMPEPGSAAPDFSLRDAAGGTFHFSEENAKRAVLLAFLSVFCDPCRLEMPVLQKLHDRHKDAGLAVVAVDLDGEPLRSAVEGFVRQEGYTFRVLIDELDARESYRAADPFGVAWIPTFFLVDKGGKVALVKTGRIREADLEKAVQSLPKR